MDPWLRAALLLVGSFFFLNGVARVVWEFVEWVAMVSWKERPPLYANGPRVRIFPQVFSAAMGLTLLLIALLS